MCGVKIRIVEDAAGQPAAELHDAQSFDGFCVEVPARWSQDPLEPLGRRAGRHLFVSAEMVRELAGPATADAAWCAKLKGMVAYAESRGWMDADGKIRAHIEIVNAPSDT